MTIIYISLLRGINVSGHKKILMSDLKLLYESLGFAKVRTCFQSGNIIFEDSERKTKESITNIIEQKIAEEYGLYVLVFVRTVEEIHEIKYLFPFYEKLNLNPKRIFVTLMKDNPSSKYVMALRNLYLLPDEFLFFDSHLYWYCEDIYTSMLTNNFFEIKLKVACTTRNWITMNRLMEITNNG